MTEPSWGSTNWFSMLQNATQWGFLPDPPFGGSGPDLHPNTMSRQANNSLPTAQGSPSGSCGRVTRKNAFLKRFHQGLPKVPSWSGDLWFLSGNPHHWREGPGVSPAQEEARQGEGPCWGTKVLRAPVRWRSSLRLNLEFRKAAFFSAAPGAHANSFTTVRVPVPCGSSSVLSLPVHTYRFSRRLVTDSPHSQKPIGTSALRYTGAFLLSGGL